jgi:isoquinoline 1-oxidoreductase beta subunit
MTRHPNMTDMNRRDFLGSAAGLTLSLTLAPLALTGEAEAQAAFAPSAWLNIATDGTITVVSPAAEMGQGSFTTLPLIIAEELDADWSKVRPTLPSGWSDQRLGNPAYGGGFQTSASASVHYYFKPLRIAGAQARRVLLDAVAAKWGVPVGELSTEPSVVVHKASGRRIGYGGRLDWHHGFRVAVQLGRRAEHPYPSRTVRHGRELFENLHHGPVEEA